MIGCFWRARRLWSWGPEDPSSTTGESGPRQRRTRGAKSTPVEVGLSAERVFRPEPRTPGPGAAWSGGRL
jgi:hypothetical protein